VTTHQTAETHFVDPAGVRFAYRRFGTPATTPLLMLQHFRGNLDNWDPAIARESEVILVDYPGVAASSGAFGPAITDAARDTIGFAEALGPDQIDLPGAPSAASWRRRSR
jgi:pimeloyl-ACP methyl ester carboxylesterase